MRERSERVVAAVAAGPVLALVLAGCGGHGAADSHAAGRHASASSGERARSADPTRIPGVGDRLQRRIPDASRQVVAVYGAGKDSASSTVRLYTRRGQGKPWTQKRSWAAHNGKKGWSEHHHQGDKRSPVGVFTLTDAGGVLPAPDAKLPYSHTDAFTPPSYWSKKTRHDFDHVIAVNYNRTPGTSPLDPTRPDGQAKGGSIWLHLDHGSGTSGCVSSSKSHMAYLLRTLDPHRHPVVVMGDKEALRR